MRIRITLFFILLQFIGNAQVVIPPFNDKYCNTVKKLESGQTDIDYKEFRESFIDSKQFKIAVGKQMVFDSLKSKMYALIKEHKYPEIISIVQQMLSIDYTSMIAHKILQQTYKIIGDTNNRTKYHAIEFGLLKSILNTGDGKTCETGWHVIQISEEYFILDMLDAQLTEQSLISSGGTCDKMEVTKDGESAVYYFEVSKVFEGYNKEIGK